ncbi:VanZ family protein [Phycicoccus sp. MAQZ13P-2]|uniref:VanZ family protein n=1 Tax=Phycicoccus mangrovi TaxID=2840470 RepID=UPI001C00469F|nr:VanZ family protein [Phycicoccus mangrovi]MBT9255839.1 VanZ family protein [Phycicoccus mangrovi]MBT9274433.1 VanZ family protein [Phycicoccus mangrovi]
MTAAPPRPGRVAGALALAATIVQLVVLYVPRAPGVDPFPHADKVVHLTVFLVPVALAVLAGVRVRWAAGVFAAHAVLSEVVQATLLPARSGDPLDAVADLTGVALGALLGVTLARRRVAGSAPARW